MCIKCYFWHSFDCSLLMILTSCHLNLIWANTLWNLNKCNFQFWQIQLELYLADPHWPPPEAHLSKWASVDATCRPPDPPTPTVPPHLKMMKMICRYNGVYCLVECIMSGTKNLTHHIQGILLFLLFIRRHFPEVNSQLDGWGWQYISSCPNKFSLS